MGLLSRFFAMIRAKMAAFLESSEDTAQALDYSYQRQLQLLQDVKRGIVEVTTSRRRLELQAAKLQENVNKLDDQARQALAAGREDLARLALQRKQAAQMQLGDLQGQVQTLEAEQQKLQQAETRLAMKVEAFRTRKETIKAQYSAAEAQVRIGEAATGLSEEMADVGLSIQRAEERVEKMRARAAAIDELVAAGTLEDYTGGGDVLDRELAKLTMNRSVDEELNALKRQLGQPTEAKSLPAEATETTSPEIEAELEELRRQTSSGEGTA